MSDENQSESAVTIEDPEKIKSKPVGVFELFKYTSIKERLLLCTGILAGLLSGLCIPANVIIFGDITNSLVYQSQNISAMADNLNMTEQEILDITGGEDLEKDIKFFAIFLALLGVMLFVFNYIFVTTFNYVAECQVFRLRTRYLECLLNKEIGWFDVHETREFTSRFTEDLNKVQEGTGEKMGIYLFYISNSVLSLITALYYGWLLTLVSLVICPFLAGSMAVMAKVTSALATSEMDGYAKAGSVAEEVISLIRTVVAFEGHEKEVERYGKNLIGSRKAGIRRGTLATLSSSLANLIIFCGFALTFWYGTKLILQSEFPKDPYDYNPKDVIIVFFSILFSAMNVGQASPYFQAFTIARGAAAEIFSILQEPSAKSEEKGIVPSHIDGKIEFENIQFSYPSRSDVPVLNGINLQVNPGESLAIVGSSGSGKSTCLQLLLRFYEPHGGKITLDGRDIQSLDVDWLRDNIGIVSQEPILFAVTIAENIRMGRQSATMEQIEEAAKQANAHNFIKNFPNGYDTLIGDSGAQISGGQKQRIAIARVILKDPKILLLDEATSSIDSSNEAVIQETLEEVRKNRTTIIVSHRLSAIQSADMIVVMENGSIAQQGTHEDFNGLYNSNNIVGTKGSSDKEHEALSNEPVLVLNNNIWMEEYTRTEMNTYYKSQKKGWTSNQYETSQEKEEETVNEKEESLASLVKQLLAYNKSEWYYIVLGIIAGIINGLAYPAYAVLFGEVMGNFAVEDPETAEHNANIIALSFTAVGIILALSEFIQNFMFTLYGANLTNRLRKTVFRAILYQEMGWFDKEENNVGSLCSRLSMDASSVQGATGIGIGLLVQSTTTLIGSFGVALYISYKLGLVLVPSIPILSFVIYQQTKIAAGQSVTEAKSLRKAGQVASEAIVNIKTVASYRKESYFVSKYKDSLRDAHLDCLRKTHLRGIYFGIAQGLPLVQYAALMAYGGYLILNEGFAYQDMFKVGEALVFGGIMVGQNMAFAPSVSKAKVSAQRIFQILKRVPKVDSHPSAGLHLNRQIEQIHVDKIGFSYPNRSSVKVLDDLSMHIEKGQTIALVGESGCGKSTIIGILLRYYNVSSGSVKLNNIDMANLNVNSIRKQFGLVSQEPVLFNRSLSANISYGDTGREVTMEEIIASAKQANIHSFIESLPDGYATMAGDKGTQLSGGQKQRIAIARALLRNPQVLLLDEATSALDSENEKIVQATLDSAQSGRTNIIVTHRLHSIQNADRIFVIKEAKVVESGSHTDLMERQGEYYHLYGSASQE